MKKIYILLTYTGTVLSKIIKVYTKDKYAHASISLDGELNYLYSFGRKNPYNPFIGGFVHEGKEIGTFKRFKKTRAAIYQMTITDEEYERIRKRIDYMEKNKDNYHFNVLGLFLAGLHIRRKKEKYFYCAEFVKYILDKSGGFNELPEIIKPDDFLNMDNIELVYEGPLKKYNELEII